VKSQRKQRNSLYISCILFGSLIGSVIFPATSPVSAQKIDAKTKQSYLFVFKEGSNLGRLSEDLKDKYKNINIDRIDDISAMSGCNNVMFTNFFSLRFNILSN